MLLLVVLIMMLIFVIVKLVFVYFICWAVIFMLVAMAMLSCAAGRQRLEQKMLDKLNRQGEENNDLSLANRLMIKKRLPEEERTMYWRTAIRLYEIALPFYLASLVLFYYPPLQKDIACELVFIKCSGEAKRKNSNDPAIAYNTCVT